jgi:hypothetical protein
MTRPHQRIPGMLLELFVPANAALAGDLVEECERRGSALWYWRQVLSAIAIAVATDIGSHKILMVRAITVGWTTMWLFSFVAVEINGFMSGWVLGSFDLVVLDSPVSDDLGNAVIDPPVDGPQFSHQRLDRGSPAPRQSPRNAHRVHAHRSGLEHLQRRDETSQTVQHSRLVSPRPPDPHASAAVDSHRWLLAIDTGRAKEWS